MERLEETFNYYASLFDCLERASAAQAHRCAGERARAERLVLGEEIRASGGGAVTMLRCVILIGVFLSLKSCVNRTIIFMCT